MIQDIDAEKFAGFDELPGHVDIFFTYMENLVDSGVREG
jgi:hypothetical protein